MSTAAASMDVSDTHSGITNAKLGIWLFLASEVMLFATLFTTLIVLRLGSAEWPRGWEALSVPLGALNTLILISSSVTMVMAYAKCYERDIKGFRLFMGLTLLLSFGFLIVKSLEYGAHFHHHEFPSTSIFNAVYFTMTGLHGFHVVCGIVVNSALFYLSGSDFDHPLFLGRVEGAGLYWHFVDIVWIFLFPALYLL